MEIGDIGGKIARNPGGHLIKAEMHYFPHIGIGKRSRNLI